MVNKNPRPVTELLTQAQIGEQCRRVTRALHHGETLTRNEISRLANIPIQTTCGRVGDLLQLGLIQRAPPRKCSISGRVNQTFRLAPPTNNQLKLDGWNQ